MPDRHGSPPWPTCSTVDNFLVTRAIHRATGLYGAAQFVISKAARKYGLRQEPGFLPTPIDIPPPGTKAAKPTVCFVGRLHRRKRPELFLDLVRQFPEVHFICVGGTNDRAYENSLRRNYAGLPNLEMTGIIDQFETDRLRRILEQSWVLVNTAAREGLPTTFLEAAANRCALLSSVDPDGFASRFGYHARGDADLPARPEFSAHRPSLEKTGRTRLPRTCARFSPPIAPSIAIWKRIDSALDAVASR